MELEAQGTVDLVLKASEWERLNIVGEVAQGSIRDAETKGPRVFVLWPGVKPFSGIPASWACREADRCILLPLHIEYRHDAPSCRRKRSLAKR